MNYRKTTMIMTAAVLLCAALSGCGDNNIIEINTLESGINSMTTTAAEGTTAVTESAATTAASKTTAASATTTAVSTTTAATSASAAETEAVTEAATEAPAANNDQQQNNTPAAPANNDTPAQNGGGQQQPPQATEAPATQPPQQQTETNLFDALHVETECSAYIASHQGYRFSEDDSCIGSGKDRTYTYSNYKLITYFENGTEILKEIDITGAGIATRKGISVGSSLADVEAAYGASDVPGIYAYSTADGTVDIIIDNGTVTSICIYT